MVHYYKDPGPDGSADAICASRCFVGIDSGLMWIAGALQARTVGLYGTEYLPKPEAVQPVNPNATYLNSPGAVSEIPAEAVRAPLGDSSSHCESVRQKRCPTPGACN